MNITELIQELEKAAWNKEALVWIELERGIDTVSRVEIENGVVTLIPSGQDNA